MTTLEIKQIKAEKIQNRIKYISEAYLEGEISKRVFEDALRILNEDLIEVLIEVKAWMK